MAVTLILVRLLVLAIIIGISAVTIALAAHYHHFTTHPGGETILWDNTLETYALAVGCINAIFFLPMLIIDRVRRNTTPPVIAELILTIIPAILWLALGLKINSTGINQISCSDFKGTAAEKFYKQFDVDLVSICRQFKVFEILGFAAFAILMLYFFYILGYTILRQGRGDQPWMKPTHELQEKEW